MKIFMCDNEFSKVINSVEAHMESFSIDRNKLYTFKRGNQKGISFRDFSDSSCAVFIVNSQWYAYSYGLMRDVPITAKKAIELSHCFFTTAIDEINRIIKSIED
jgi:hypothetical protein